MAIAFTGDVTFAGATLELKGSMQYIRKRTFIEIIYLIKHPDITTFVLNDTFSLKIVSGSIQCLTQKIFLAAVAKFNDHYNLDHDHN